jgi:superfamily II DNA or RNA helicase
MEYAAAADDERYRLAATAHAKIGVVKDLVARHAGEQILVIGQYLDQIDVLSEALDAPKITGATPVDEREELFGAFREGRMPVLVVSKVANFSIDLPEASVAIQVSGSFGSRQEEAQRLGRLLRPSRTGTRRASTRSSPATRSTRTSRRTGSASSPSRATATRSSTPRASPPRRAAAAEHEPARAAAPAARRRSSHSTSATYPAISRNDHRS